jgi:hypothetical protein
MSMASEAKHTAGPWSSPLTYGVHGLEIHGADGHQVCIIPGEAVYDGKSLRPVGTKRREYAMEDARLIAAAPDMLAALELAEHFIRTAKGHFTQGSGLRAEGERILPVVRAALARATGDGT